MERLDEAFVGCRSAGQAGGGEQGEQLHAEGPAAEGDHHLQEERL